MKRNDKNQTKPKKKFSHFKKKQKIQNLLLKSYLLHGMKARTLNE